jgi:hypothetical protein
MLNEMGHNIFESVFEKLEDLAAKMSENGFRPFHKEAFSNETRVSVWTCFPSPA